MKRHICNFESAVGVFFDSNFESVVSLSLYESIRTSLCSEAIYSSNNDDEHDQFNRW